MQSHTNFVRSVAITSDNKFIVSGGDDITVRIWNLQDKTQEAALQGHTAIITISGGDDNTVRIWDLQNKN